MAIETESKMIGDNEFSVTQWNAEKALLNKLKLIKVLGPSLALFASLKKEHSQEDEVRALSEGLEKVFQNTQPEELVDIIKSFIIGTGCNDKRITDGSFNSIFNECGMLDIYRVFAFVIQVNYSNLLKSRLAGSLLAKAKTAMDLEKSPSTKDVSQA